MRTHRFGAYAFFYSAKISSAFEKDTFSTSTVGSVHKGSGNKQVICAKDSQPENANSPIKVMGDVSTTSTRDGQLLKVYALITVIPRPKITLFKLSHLLNTL